MVIHQLPTTGSYLSGTIRSGYKLSNVIYFYHTLKLLPLETLTWMEKTLKVLVPGEITLETIIPLSNHTPATRKDLQPLYKKTKLRYTYIKLSNKHWLNSMVLLKLMRK